MSVGFNPKNELTMNQSLKVQELAVKGSDRGLYQISGGNCFIMIREPVDQVYVASCKVDASNLVTQFAQANIIIVDSTSLVTTAPSDRGAIELVGLAALQPNDCIIVRYAVLEHL